MNKSRYTRKYEALLRVLREARIEAQLTQAEVAHKFAAHASFISKIESGERRIDVVELSELCRHYGIALSELLRRAGLE